MKARAALVLVVLVTAASLFPMFAKANHQDTTDGNDANGKLDIREAKSFGRSENPGWKVISFSRLTVREMRDRGFVLVYLDTFGDSRFDYYALVSSNGSKMRGSLWRDSPNRADRRLSKVLAWRTDSRSVSVRVPLSKMNTGGRNRLTYRWYVKTLFTGDSCPRVCLDRAPNNNVLIESNGKPTPSPTDTGPNLTESPEPPATPDTTESSDAPPRVPPTP